MNELCESRSLFIQVSFAFFTFFLFFLLAFPLRCKGRWVPPGRLPWPVVVCLCGDRQAPRTPITCFFFKSAISDSARFVGLMLDCIEWLLWCEFDVGWIRFAGSWRWVLVVRVGVLECKYWCSSTVRCCTAPCQRDYGMDINEERERLGFRHRT